MTDQALKCSVCGSDFALPPAVASKFPGWRPSKCLPCSRGGGAEAKQGRPAKRDGATSAAPRATAKARATSGGGARGYSGAGSSAEQKLTVAEVLERYSEGPTDGIFTDGACSGNPGPGGWGAVLVRHNEVVAQRHGKDRSTTNNRMELTAIIEGFKILESESREPLVLYTDSELCVKTLTQWAASWKRNGWRRKDGPVKNLELVQEAYALHLAYPNVEVRWLRGHSGLRWNEYADALSTAWMRDVL